VLERALQFLRQTTEIISVLVTRKSITLPTPGFVFIEEKCRITLKRLKLSCCAHLLEMVMGVPRSSSPDLVVSIFPYKLTSPFLSFNRNFEGLLEQ